MTSPLQRMTVTEIARLANVQRSTVSNWQRRHEDFPKPLPDSPGRPQFDGAAVREWLAQRYPDTSAATGWADDLLTRWYAAAAEGFAEDSNPDSFGFALLIAAADGRGIDFGEYDGGDDLSVVMTVDGLDAIFFATPAVAAELKALLEHDVATLSEAERTELIEAAAAQVEEQARWRRTDDAGAAERNLHDLFSRIIGRERRVVDFSCGTGGLLAAVGDRTAATMLTGMERDPEQSFISGVRLARRYPSTVIDADVLAAGVAGQSHDCVVSIPPFGRPLDDVDPAVLRSLPFGAPRGNADVVWPQLAFQALAPDGEALLVLPHTLTVEDRSDQVRREMIRQGVLMAVITLPVNAHPTSRTLTDLWVISREGRRGSDVLFGDASGIDPTADGSYDTLAKTVANWIDDIKDGSSPQTDATDPQFVHVNPIELLDQSVILDPQYWCAKRKTPTAASELIAQLAETAEMIQHAFETLAEGEFEPISLLPAAAPSITVREAAEDGLLTVVTRAPRSAPKSGRKTSKRLAGAVSIEDAERMRGVRYGRIDPGMPTWSDFAAHALDELDHTIRAGDVLVWATSDREVRTVVWRADSGTASPGLTVLRCGPELDPDYLALVLTAGRNDVYTTGSTTAALRALDLLLPLVPVTDQHRIVNHIRSVETTASLTQMIARLIEQAYIKQIADALGSGSLTIDDPAD